LTDSSGRLFATRSMTEPYSLTERLNRQEVAAAPSGRQVRWSRIPLCFPVIRQGGRKLIAYEQDVVRPRFEAAVSRKPTRPRPDNPAKLLGA